MMQFLQLNNDVILEIFLQFVAIDWDGPFTLMLVCTKWSNLVLSQSRVWTWIMIDDTQAEWRERMEIGAYLSKKLPLQIVLRVPFESQVSLSHITRRCTCLFLDSKCVEDRYFFTRARSWVKRIISYEQFTAYSAELKQSNDSLLNLLNGAPIHDIQIRSEDRHYSSLAYSAWHVYERLNQRTCIQEVTKSRETFIITALVFKHMESAPLPRIRLLVSDLWGILPLLSNLCYLELSDNYMRAPGDTVLAQIQLRSLQTLKIESPMMSSVFFSLEDDVWPGLLSILDSVIAPNLADLGLRGPLHRVIAALIKSYGRFHLLQLDISISLFDETVDQEKLDSKPVWRGLRRCTVLIPEQNEARPHTDSEVLGALRLLFNLIPRHCFVQLHGDAILEPILQSDLLMDVELHIITQMDHSGYVHDPHLLYRKIRSLSITGKHSKKRKPVPWILSVEKLWISSSDDMRIRTGLTLNYPNGDILPVRVLECTPHTVFQPQLQLIGDVTRCDIFENLADIDCDCDLAVWMITNHETPHLRSLTLSKYDGQHNSFSAVFNVIKQASHRLLSLDTLRLPGAPLWHHLLPFVARFNRSQGRGISAVKLDELPHPAILRQLGRAFRGEASSFDFLVDLFKYHRSQMRRNFPRGCEDCTLFGWSCYGEQHCRRRKSSDVVTITDGMPLTEYKGGWGPDGQDWEHDLLSSDEGEMDVDKREDMSSSDEREMDTGHENAGPASEMSVE